MSDQGYVTWVEGADEVEFAKLALDYAKKAGISKEQSLTAGESLVVFENLPLGYYLVDSSLGALCGLDTTNNEVIIQEKNAVPTIDKQVQEDSDNSWGNHNDADIGQTVNFKTTVHAKKGAENYVVHDKMSAGLTLKPETIAVEGLTKDKDYTVKAEGFTDGCSFEIAFTKEYLKTITKDTDIVITYAAILNENAKIADGVNANDTKLTYGDNNSTEWIQTQTKTYQFQLVKTDTDKKILEGAEFELYDAFTGGNKIALVMIEEGIYRVATAAEKAAEDFTSAVIKAGQATIQGLDGSTTYYLEEVKAPAGYNKLAERVAVAIAQENLNAQAADGAYVSGGVQVINNTGSLLPDTGGMGTTIFYLIGGILVVAAVVLMVAKKRMHSDR